MIDSYLARLERGLGGLPESLQQSLCELACLRLVEQPHGDLPRWLAAVASLPAVTAELQVSGQGVHLVADAGADVPNNLAERLMALHPWRKGPFGFLGQHIDTEWRSDWKWQRVVPHIADLAGRRVLDVGCGSGYHLWRMWGEGASLVVGIDPGVLFFCQFLAFKQYQPELPVWFVPARMEELPAGSHAFDTVFSMGVLYHRRSPLDHLLELFGALRPGGELVLETLVIEGGAETVLMPGERYAQMRNVFFLPSSAALTQWLVRCGFKDARVVDETVTTVEEQRSTPWMRFHSLEQFLDPADPTRTVEGYPAPRRATIGARRPDA